MITSQTNQHIKRLIKLKQSSKTRTKEQVFIIEGIKLFLEAPEHLIKEIYISKDFHDKITRNNNPSKPNQPLKAKLSAQPYEIISNDLFNRISDTKTPQGILCILKQINHNIEDFFAHPSNPLYLILEDIRDPGNLGTIFRTAEAAGVTGIIMAGGCADIYNPKTIRSTMGSIFRVNFAYTDNLSQTITDLKNQNINLYAACPENAALYNEYNYQAATAFIIGSESQGLKPETIAFAHPIKLPMAGKVESLNAAIAASIILYEAVRQRVGSL